MILNKNNYTVESVTCGHPDKICDQISDAILDAYLKDDPRSRVAMETFGAHGLLVLGGEVTSSSNVDVEKIARQVYKDIGYDDELEIVTNIIQQSPDIAQGVDTGGAGDQGIMYGYACDDNAKYLPDGVVLAHALAKRLEDLRKEKKLSWLKPDGKTQVTYDEDRLKTILVSTQHDENISQEEIREQLIEYLIAPLMEDLDDVKVLINPTGKFEIGGFIADTGLTGRKIMVDTYGGLIPHGGGAFSGKDSTKVDRSAAYMARFVAKNIVANGLAKECFVAVAYAIGKEEPVMVRVINEKGEDISNLVKKYFDFRPKKIIERLNLQEPIFQKTAAYGHFGKDDLPWEEIIVL